MTESLIELMSWLIYAGTGQWVLPRCGVTTARVRLMILCGLPLHTPATRLVLGRMIRFRGQLG
jgi:hypothetical protein